MATEIQLEFDFARGIDYVGLYSALAKELADEIDNDILKHLKTLMSSSSYPPTWD